MSKKTLLQLVQNILSAMDSDEVNSISDSVESLQVAEIVRETYEDLVATLSLPERRALVHLEALGDVTRPNYLRIPDSVKDFIWIKYDSADVDYMAPEIFIRYVFNNPGDLVVRDFDGIEFSIRSDADPKFWTCFNDEYIVFDAFNSEVESTLQESKTTAFANMDRPFLMEDDFVCDMDANLFPLLLAESKKACFINLKQVSNSNEEMRARRQLVRAQNELSRTAKPRPIDRLPNYGRRR